MSCLSCLKLEVPLAYAYSHSPAKMFEPSATSRRSDCAYLLLGFILPLMPQLAWTAYHMYGCRRLTRKLGMYDRETALDFVHILTNYLGSYYLSIKLPSYLHPYIPT